MAQDEYGIYKKPTFATFMIWLAISAAIFFGAYSVKMKSRLSVAMNETRVAREELDELKLTVVRQQGDIQTMKIALAKAGELQSVTKAISVLPPAGNPTALASDSAVVAVVEKTPVVTKVLERNTVVKKPEVSLKEDIVAIPARAEIKKVPNTDDGVKVAGEILTYNPDTRRAYLSLGSANGGVQAGTRFSVWRGEKYVTDIRVVKVFSVTSTCEIQGPTPIGLRPGDIAKIAKGI